jgi:glycerophosphoryl diester phosphodiesterase
VRVLAHRGLWPAAGAPNSLEAMAGAMAAGFGVETDVRDLDGEIVISHDPPRRGAPTLSALLDAPETASTTVLAVNVKADGLQRSLRTLLDAARCEWFLFDLSVPDLVAAIRHELRCFTRQSDFEPEPALYDRAAGVWVDGFETEWWDEALIAGHLERGKQVCMVSPELHGRDHLDTWRRWASWSVWQSDDVMLCTDHPVEALEALAA